MIVKNQLKILTALLVTHHFPLMTAIDSPQSLACTENAGILPPRFARRQNDRQRAPHDMPKAMSDLLDYAITNSPPRVFSSSIADSRAFIATSSWVSSGSRVVIRCNQRPGCEAQRQIHPCDFAAKRMNS